MGLGELRVVGKRMRRVDGMAKVTGGAKYYSDIQLPGMLYGKILRSPHAHAKILKIDTRQAKRHPGVKAVITAEDTPKIRYSLFLHPDYDDKLPLEDRKVRYFGDEVAAVAAVSEEIAEEALDLIKVDYEPLPAVFEPEEATKPGASLVHDERKSNIFHEYHWSIPSPGDVEEGFRIADYLFEDRFVTTQQAHVCAETHGCIAYWDVSGNLTLWTGTQIPFYLRMQLSKTLNMPQSNIRIMSVPIGGGFGSRCDMFPYEPIASLLSKATGRPVKIVLSREEEFVGSRTRNPFIITLKTGVKKDGALTARHATIILDKGAYFDQGEGVLVTAGWIHNATYRVPAVKLDGYIVYTNKNYGGAFRGYGMIKIVYAIESQMDIIAKKIGIDPLELRLKNANQPGDLMVDNTKITTCGLSDCLRKVADAIGWKEKKKHRLPNRGIGIACGMDVTGTRGFMGDTDAAAATVSIIDDGTVNLAASGVDIGTGYDTVITQIAAEELGATSESIRLTTMDTGIVPYNVGVTYADRSTFVSGNAVRAAAADAKKQLFEIAAEMFEVSVEDVESSDSKIYVKSCPDTAKTFAEVATWGYSTKKKPPIIGRGNFDPDSTLINPATGKSAAPPGHCATYPFEAVAVEVEVDPETGQVKISKIVSAHDCGRVINPMLAEAQVEGGLLQSLGFGMMEEGLIYSDGRVVNRTLADYKLFTAADIPDITTFFVGVPDPKGPYGAKGLGNQSVMLGAPAFANAVHDAVGVRIRDLPITPEKILRELKKRPK